MFVTTGPTTSRWIDAVSLFSARFAESGAFRLFLMSQSMCCHLVQRAKESSESTGASSISLDNESAKISRLFFPTTSRWIDLFSLFSLCFSFFLFFCVFC